MKKYVNILTKEQIEEVSEYEVCQSNKHDQISDILESNVARLNFRIYPVDAFMNLLN